MLGEAKRGETMVEFEVRKIKAKIENEIAHYHKEIEIPEIKLQAMKNNYQICSWIFCVLCLFLFGYTSKGLHDSNVGRMTLP